MSGLAEHRPPEQRPERVRIPADVDRPDRLLAGLTARQLVVLAGAALVLWTGYAATRRVLPFPVFCALGTPVALVAAALALGRRDGLGLDRFLAAAVRQARRPRRLVPAPDGVRGAPVWSAVRSAGPVPAALDLPVRGVSPEGTVDLGPDGAALVCRASTISFALRTADEQRALVAAFGRYLNGLAQPLQVVVRSEPVDISTQAAELRQAAGGLPHPALERAAVAHARYLDELSARTDLLGRQVLVVLRDPVVQEAGDRLRRAAEEARRSLGAAGVRLSVLDGAGAVAALAGALDPFGTPRVGAATGTVTGPVDDTVDDPAHGGSR